MQDQKMGSSIELSVTSPVLMKIAADDFALGLTSHSK